MTKTKQKTVNEKSGFSLLSVMQNIGKSLVFPIATLPAAALLLRFGAFIGTYGDMSGSMVEQIAYWVGFIMQTPGAAVFDNMPLIFGIGVAFGFAKENRGEVALVGAIAYFALIGLAQNENSLSSLLYGQVNLGNATLNPDGSVLHSDLLYLNIFDNTNKVLSTSWLMNFGVFGGILSGLLSANLYNKFADVRLHPALGFFSGRRFVPIVTLFSMIGVSLIMAATWPWINLGLIKFSILVSKIPFIGAGVYGFINRLLIPFGLHQVLNTYFWFQSPVVTEAGSNLMVLQDGKFAPILGDITGFSLAIDGTVFQWTQDSTIYQAILHTNGLGDNATMTTATFDSTTGVVTDTGAVIPGAIAVLQGSNMGMYQAGFFPTMMFGLPAVAIAMAVKSEKEHKKAVWAFMLAGSLVAFLTGITEPLEFSFMFISPIIYFVYSLLTGIYATAVVYLHISVGFGFSAGLIDWVLSILSGGVGTLSALGSWANLELLVIGVAAAIINFTIVWFLIGVFKIATPGRKGNVAGLTNNINSGKGNTKAAKDEKWTRMAMDTIDFIGKENIENIDNCITRLRLTVKNNSKYSDSGIVAIGYTGVVKVGKKAYQAIIGPEAEIIANEMRRLLSEGYGDESKKIESNSLKKEIDKKEVVKDEPKLNESYIERFNRLYDEFEERAKKRNS